jgi:hypothetical protein
LAHPGAATRGIWLALPVTPDAASALRVLPRSAEAAHVMGFNLTESVVREYLRDHPGEAHCADCVTRALGQPVPSREISGVMAELAERRPPFAAGRCRCGTSGLMFAPRQ